MTISATTVTVMSFSVQERRSAQAALVELVAVEPNREPVELNGEDLAWGTDKVALIEAERDPANAAAMRPHVVAACQRLLHHRPVRLRCTCGKHLEFLALAAFATGVQVVSSPRLVPPGARVGGVADLAPVGDDDPDARWSLLSWERVMLKRDRTTVHTSSWQAPAVHSVLGPGAGVIGDACKRTTFICEACEATPTFLNVTLLRFMLEAIAADEAEIRVAETTSPERAFRT
jgi:hypothetical protein